MRSVRAHRERTRAREIRVLLFAGAGGRMQQQLNDPFLWCGREPAQDRALVHEARIKQSDEAVVDAHTVPSRDRPQPRHERADDGHLHGVERAPCPRVPESRERHALVRDPNERDVVLLRKPADDVEDRRREMAVLVSVEVVGPAALEHGLDLLAEVGLDLGEQPRAASGAEELDESEPIRPVGGAELGCPGDVRAHRAALDEVEVDAETEVRARREHVVERLVHGRSVRADARARQPAVGRRATDPLVERTGEPEVVRLDDESPRLRHCVRTLVIGAHALADTIRDAMADEHDDRSTRRSSSRRSGSSSTGSVVTFDPDSLRVRIAELENELAQPGFWDDQQRAAAVSAEHARLARRVDRYDRLTREYEDAKELLAMDESLAAEVAQSIVPLRARAGTPAGGRAFLGRVRRGRRRRHDPGRRGRHRRAGLGRDPPAHVPPLGRGPRLPDGGARNEPRRGVRDQVGDVHCEGRQRVRDPQGGARQAPPRPAQPVRLGAPPAHELRAGDRRAAASRRRHSRDRRRRSPHRHVPLVRRRRPAREQDRLGGAHHAHAVGHRRRGSERAQPVVEQGHGDEDPPLAPRRDVPRRSARPSWRASAAASTWASAAPPSAATSSIRTSS